MNKIIVGLVAIAMSLGMAASAQTQSVQSSEINSAGVSSIQVQEKVQTVSGTAVEPLKTQVKETKTNSGLKAGIKNMIKAGQEKVAEVKNKLISGKATSSEALKEAKNKAEMDREALKTKMETGREAIKTKAETAKEELKAKREQAQEQLKAEKEAFQAKVEAAKEEVKIKREQEKEALKVKLQDIKSAAKKATVQKLDENMNKLNSNFVEKFTKNLTDFDTYLSRLVDKANATSTTNKDMAAFNGAVESARTAIVAARTAVEAQSKKTYSIAVSTEANLRSDVDSLKGILNNDLKFVRDLVQAAHLATVKVLTEFNKVKNK